MTYNGCPIVHSRINTKDLSIVKVFWVDANLNHAPPLSISNIILLHSQVILYPILIKESAILIKLTQNWLYLVSIAEKAEYDLEAIWAR